MADTEEQTLDETTEDAENLDEKKGSDGDDEAVVPTRRSAMYFATKRIEGRKVKEQAKEDAHEEVEEELTSKAKEAIHKEIEPFVEMSKKQADELELREYLVDHPGMRKHETAIRKRMEQWKDVPVSEIAKTVGKPSEDDDGREKAEAKAKARRLAGTSNAATEPKLPTSQADMKAMYDRVKKGRETIDLKQMSE